MENTNKMNRLTNDMKSFEQLMKEGEGRLPRGPHGK